MTDFLYKTIQDALTKKLYPDRCTNRQQAFNSGILAAKSIFRTVCKGEPPSTQYNLVMKTLEMKAKNYQFYRGRFPDAYQEGLKVAMETIERTFQRYKDL